MKINRSLTDASKQIERQTTQINKLNQDLQSLQKQMSVGQRQTEIVKEIRSQSKNQIQKTGISSAQKHPEEILSYITKIK